MDFSLDDGLSNKQTALIIGGAIVVVLSIILATYHRIINMQRAGLLMDATLTIATLGYVFLTYNMVSQMRKDIEVRKRHQYSPHVKERLEKALLPLIYDIKRIRRILKDGESEWNGPDVVTIGDSIYRSYHEIGSGYNTRTIPRFTTHLDVENALTYAVYQAVDEYSEVYREAVYRLRQLILEEVDDFQGDSDKLRDFAILALKLDDGHHGPSQWDSFRDTIVPLRDEIPELMSELDESRKEVNTACHEAVGELNSELNHALNEYEISEGELEPESPPDPTQIFTKGLHKRAGFETSIETVSEEDGDEIE